MRKGKTMSDYISRQAVTNKLEKHKYSRDYCVLHNIDWAIDFGMAMASVDSIPSADVRPNIHGHWIKINSGDEDFPESIVCDRCNHENSHLDFNEHNEPIGKVFVTSNFCPNCGADMRGVSE